MHKLVRTIERFLSFRNFFLQRLQKSLQFSSFTFSLRVRVVSSSGAGATDERITFAALDFQDLKYLFVGSDAFE